MRLLNLFAAGKRFSPSIYMRLFLFYTVFDFVVAWNGI
jgi:hypothetical protein